MDNQSAPPSFEEIEKGNQKFSKSDDNLKMLNNKNDLAKNIENLNLNESSKVILKPRDYQKKIFEKAKNQNSIIYVETGKGKTFISIMLMADFLGLDIENPSKNKKIIDKNKKIIFFVCDTALIEQQKKAISNILGIEVGTIQGKKKKKSKSDYDIFRKMWESVNIFVAIPSIIYKILSSGFLKIFDISMLIFDECHHTNDDHPYNKIMNEFYFFYKRKLKDQNLNYPRIYGLTASPIKKGIKEPIEPTVLKSMEKLSENLDCVIVIDPEMNNSNAKMMKLGESIAHYLKDDTYIEVKPHFEIEEYKSLLLLLYNNCFLSFMSVAFFHLKNQNPKYLENENTIEQYQNYILTRLKAHNLEEYNIITEKYISFYNFRKISPFFAIFEKLLRQIFMILENLCLNSLILFFNDLIEIYHKLYLQKIEEEKKNHNKNINNENNNKSLIKSLDNIDENDNEDDSDEENDSENLTSSLIQDIKDIYSKTVEKLIEFRDKENKNYISDRLEKLYLKIKDLFNKNDKSKFIVFISNRIVAHFLHPELNIFLNKNFKNKKCKEIIGINKRKADGGTTLTPSLTLKEMNEIIKQFNEGKFDILIGTSAIEEGLDIQSCNAVLTLVELRTPKSFIQIKGRARKSNSDFIIFTNSRVQGRIKIENFLKVGQKMNELFKDDILKDFRRKNFISLKEDFMFEFDSQTHSKLTFGNITVFYNEIIQQIKACKIEFDVNINIIKIKSTNNKASEFEYKGEIKISTDLNDVSSEFPYTTDNLNSKENATKMSYFYILHILKNKNYLDHHLKFCMKKNI